MLEILELLAYNPSDIIIAPTTAVIFRTAAATQLFDEVDTWQNGDELRGVLNAGFKNGAKVLRHEKDEEGHQELRSFSAYGPKALAGIGTKILNATTRDRTFTVAMIPQTRQRTVTSWRQVTEMQTRQVTTCQKVVVPVCDPCSGMVHYCCHSVPVTQTISVPVCHNVPEPPVENFVGMPERCSRARVRSAAPKTGAPLRAVRRSGYRLNATGGSGGMGLGSLFFDRTKFNLHKPAKLRQNINQPGGPN